MKMATIPNAPTGSNSSSSKNNKYEIYKINKTFKVFEGNSCYCMELCMIESLYAGLRYIDTCRDACICKRANNENEKKELFEEIQNL